MSFLESLKSAKKQMRAVPRSLTDPSTPLAGKTTLEKLVTLHQTRKTGNLPSSTKPLDTKAKRMIAVCLVIVDRLPQEDIWKAWLSQADHPEARYTARLFIQAKHPESVQSEWVRQFLIPVSFCPTWNSPEVVRAMLATADEAIKYREDGVACDRFLFGTEFCIPIRSLEEMGRMVFEQEKSWLNARHHSTDNWEKIHCFDAVKPSMIPPAAVWKSLPGWIMLTRRHATEILALVNRLGGYDKSSTTDIITAFGPGGTWEEHQEGVWAPEEVFFPTMLALLGYLREPPNNDEVLRKSAVFAKWRNPRDSHPIDYSDLSPEVLDSMHQAGCVMARKFKELSLQRWLEVVMKCNTDGSSDYGSSEQRSSSAVNDQEDNTDDFAQPQKKQKLSG